MQRGGKSPLSAQQATSLAPPLSCVLGSPFQGRMHADLAGQICVLQHCWCAWSARLGISCIFPFQDSLCCRCQMSFWKRRGWICSDTHDAELWRLEITSVEKSSHQCIHHLASGQIFNKPFSRLSVNLCPYAVLQKVTSFMQGEADRHQKQFAQNSQWQKNNVVDMKRPWPCVVECVVDYFDCMCKLSLHLVSTKNESSTRWDPYLTVSILLIKTVVAWASCLATSGVRAHHEEPSRCVQTFLASTIVTTPSRKKRPCDVWWLKNVCMTGCQNAHQSAFTSIRQCRSH